MPCRKDKKIKRDEGESSSILKHRFCCDLAFAVGEGGEPACLRDPGSSSRVWKVGPGWRSHALAWPRFFLKSEGIMFVAICPTTPRRLDAFLSVAVAVALELGQVSQGDLHA